MASLTREKAEEICQHIRTNPDSVFGQKYWQCRHACVVQSQQKADKWETRFLAIAKFRVFLLHGKSISTIKLEKSFNILALRNLELLQQEQILQIGWEDRPGGTKTFSSTPIVVLHLFLRKPDGSKTKDLALELLSALKHYFPEIQKSLTKMFISLSPPSLIADFAFLPFSTPELPCHNFRRSYVAYCDWMEQPFRDEIIWDIERIYFFHGQHELDLNDFSHLSLKDQQALIGSIQFTSFFTGIFADSLRLQNEQIDSIFLLIRRSHSLRSLYLNRCTLPIKDFLSQFSVALSTNINLPLERLRFVGIALEDKKGLTQLGTLLPQLSSLRALSFADCLLNEKCALALLNGLHHGIRLSIDSAKCEDATVTGNTLINSDNGRFQLEALNLSGNPLGSGVELAEQLANFLALNTGAIRFLDLNGTAIQLDRLWAALKLGGLGIEVLRLGGCHLAQTKRSVRNSGKDNAQIAKELFCSFLSLKELDMTGTHLTAELLSGILEGISSNPNLSLSSLSFCLDNCIVGSTAQCVNVFEQYLLECPCICSLSLRDNSLEHETYRLLPIICKMRELRQLDIGGANFFGLKANKKHSQMLSAIVTEFVRLVNGEDDESTLDDLSLSDSRLGSHLSILLNALGLSRSLRKLNLSNCDLGPGGARLLGKSLQLNKSLRQLSLDRNQIGIEGFYELARALRLNSTLLTLNLPTSDLTDSMTILARIPIEKARLMAIIAEIEEALKRNIDFSTRLTNGQLAMRTMHSLNIGCDRYNINGSETSEIKKVAFHKIGKLIAQIGEQKSDDITNIFVNNSFKNDSEKRRIKIVDKFVEELGHFVEENNKNFLCSFSDRLATQESIEIQFPSDTNILPSNNNIFEKQIKEDLLKEKLIQFFNTYSNECAWEHLFFNLDNALRLDEQNNCFKILEQKIGTIKTTTISNKKGILLRSPADSKSSNYRPISSIMSNNNHHQNGSIPSIMSQSVLGNFSFFENEKEENKLNETSSSSSSNLVHLSKLRPKPARLQQQKKKLVKETEEEEAVNALDEVLAEEEEEEEEITNIPLVEKVHNSPEPSLISSSHGQTLELSPLLRQQRLKHIKENNEEKNEFLSTQPPPIPLKRGTSYENSALPKLPPKPSSPLADVENRSNNKSLIDEKEIVK